MTEPTMPHVCGGGRGEESSGPSLVIAGEWIEIARASGDHEDPPGAKILHKKAERVKFDRTRIVVSELT